MVHRYQIFMLYTRNLHNEKKKAFKDNFAITFYPPQLFEYLSYPNESWKSWDRKMRLEKTRLLSLSPLSRRPRLRNGQYCCLEVPLHRDFRYCSVEWHHDRRTWFKVSQTTQDKNLTWERRNTDPWDHKWHCSFQIEEEHPDARVPSKSQHLSWKNLRASTKPSFSPACVKEITRLQELIPTTKTQSMNNSAPKHEDWFRDRHVPHQGQRVCPAVCSDDEETSTTLFSWNRIYRCLTFPMIWTKLTREETRESWVPGPRDPRSQLPVYL